MPWNGWESFKSTWVRDDGDMTNGRRGGLDTAAKALAAISILTTVCAGVAAGVAAARDSSDGSGTLVRGTGQNQTAPNSPRQPVFDYSGWTVVSGQSGKSGDVATYRVPASDWKSYGTDYVVSFRDTDDKTLASGHALANYYGNSCSDDDTKVAGGWTVLADTEPSGDLETIAEDAVRRWAQGYATNADGTTAKMSEPNAELVGLDDGTTAARARIEVDMSVFSGPCLPQEAEVMATTIDSPDGAKTLVQARYVTNDGGITDREWNGISQSLAE